MTSSLALMSAHQRRIDRANDSVRSEFNPDNAIEILHRVPLDEVGAEATPFRLLDWRPLNLVPGELQAMGRSHVVQRPMQINLPNLIGECAVLHRVCRQFLERHS